MDATTRIQKLNDAFKRFQPLPELPAIEANLNSTKNPAEYGQSVRLQSLMQSAAEEELNLTGVLTG